MLLQLDFKINKALFVKDPNSSELGRSIVSSAINLILELGMEHFTFKKLSTQLSTTEASIYRYFENKHQILLYILNWYWNYLEYVIHIKAIPMSTPIDQIKAVLKLLDEPASAKIMGLPFDIDEVKELVTREGNKGYFIKEVVSINEKQGFKSYKDLCALIAEIFKAYNPKYKYAKSLAAFVLEGVNHQSFFMRYLPGLTDSKSNEKDYNFNFWQDSVFKILNAK